jgi:hypothetical protein
MSLELQQCKFQADSGIYNGILVLYYSFVSKTNLNTVDHVDLP